MNATPDDTIPAADYDGGWKEALERYLSGLTELCFPEINDQIAWEAGFTFLDKELQEVVRDAELGKQHVDKLVQVQLKEGQSQRILLHIEVASQSYVQLARTMYLYHHRLEDRFGQPVLSVAILADDNPHWRPCFYEKSILGCHLRFDFPTCKLLDFRQNWQALEHSENPAAMVIMAHLRALETSGNMNQRLAYRWALTQMLYGKSYGKKDILELFRLLDWLMKLPTKLELDYERKVLDYEKEFAMPFLSSFEQRALERGEKIGGHKVLLRQLRARCGELPQRIGKMVEQELSSSELEDLTDAVLDFRGLADLENWLAARK